MTLATRAVATAVLAAAIAVLGFLGPLHLFIGALVLAVAFAVGWSALTDLPFPPGSAAVIALTGGGAVGVVYHRSAVQSPDLRDVAIVFAGSVLLTFVNELLRRDGRTRLVESVAGTVTGSLMAACAAGWVACGRSNQGLALVVAGAVALAVASALSAVRMPRWLTTFVISLGGAGGGALLGFVLPVLGPLAGVLAGLAVGMLVAAMQALFHPLAALRRKLPAFTAVVLPVVVTGMLVYVVGRVLLG